MNSLRSILAFLIVALSGTAHCDQIRVAVAANFAVPFQKLAIEFEKQSGHRVIASAASTGKLYAQVKNGAPFQVFLSADDETPARLDNEDLVVKGSRFTYAVGRLALWSINPKLIDERPEILKSDSFKHIAIANPALAPYGQAAIQTLKKLNIHSAVQGRIVMGENIGQTYQFVSSGNAELGFVALSQVMVDGRMSAGSFWLVPPSMHDSIRQDAALLVKGKDSSAAKELLVYLKSPPARALITASGYGH